VLEPLRWALDLKPEWVALEQVKEAQPIWDLVAVTLQGRGYSVWTGVLSAEQYGVPQTRKRSILIASRVRTVGPPEPTHQRFDGGPAQHSLCGTLQPWVSMAEALGWGMTERPTPTIAAGKTGNGRLFGSEQRSGAILSRERAEGRWALDPRASMGKGMVERHGPREPVPADQPAPVITGNAAAMRWQLRDTGITHGGTTPEGGRIRRGDEPAPTITSRADQLQAEELGSVNTGRDWKKGQDRDDAQVRSASDPAPTLSARSGGQWWLDRPSTTVAGDRRVHPPGHKENGAESMTKRFLQVGNAVPPLLALRVLEEATGQVLDA
jgi:DNA (cytosine-5)-methyltransferase 1